MRAPTIPGEFPELIFIYGLHRGYRHHGKENGSYYVGSRVQGLF